MTVGERVRRWAAFHLPRRSIDYSWVVVTTHERLRNRARVIALESGQAVRLWDVQGQYRTKAAARRAALRSNGWPDNVDSKTQPDLYRTAQIRSVNYGMVMWLPGDYLESPHQIGGRR